MTSDMSPPTVAAPSGHPAAGVASAGAAQLTASTAPGAALAPTNAPAQMTAQPTSGPLHRQQEKKDKEDRELKKFVEAPGHFSLVR